jgi:predicted nucleic acid-binding protein
VVYDQSFDNAPIVFLDANLLYPFHLRNLLVQLSVERLVKVRWSAAVHEEWISNLVADGRVTRDRLQRTRKIMDHVLPDATVRGYERHIEGLSLPDQNDRHVLAAAIEAGASIILTFNLKDFPPEQLASHRIVARHPDSFLCELHSSDPGAVEAAVDAARLNLTVTAPAVETFVAVLKRQGLISFAATVYPANTESGEVTS